MPFCNKCGNKLSDGAIFCNRCGNKLPESAVVPPPAPQPAPVSPVEEKVFEAEVVATPAPKKMELVYLNDGQCQCMNCNGTGKDFHGENCITCEGSGALSEQKAQDEIEVRKSVTNFNIRATHCCSKCNGVGKKKNEKCEPCGGLGIIYLVDCVDCNGSGVEPNGTTCSTCNGTKLISSVEANSIIEAREDCAKFKKNPAVALIMPVIAIVVAAVSARFLFNMILVDFSMVTTWRSFVPAIIMIIAIGVVFGQCISLFKGSKHDPAKGGLRTLGVGLVCVALLAALIAGPATGGYGWLEGQAKDIINDKYPRTNCTSVSFESNDGDTYYGVANLSNGLSAPIAVHYKGKRKGRGVSYEIYVQPLW